MMKYEVIKYFTDLQDNGYAYNVGDSFPRQGITVSEERISQLLTSNNKRGCPFIKKVKDVSPMNEPVEPAEEVKEKPKRRSKKNESSK